MSILRTHNLQNPDSSTINIVMDQGGNTNIAGITTVGSDLNISDKIIHTGDTDTAIRFPADDTITVETAGSERLRITSAGRMLLGTTTEGHESADDFTISDSGDVGITLSLIHI